MKKIKPEIDYSMDFEVSMRQFFGNNAYHIADGAGNPKFAKKWLIKAVRRMQKDVIALETTTRHKERLMSDLEQIEKSLKESKNEWHTIFRLFFLCSRFLGYDFADGLKYLTPFYHQTLNQHYYSKNNESSDFNTLEEHSKDIKNAVAKQKEIIKSLRKEGNDDFHVSLVLGMSEYRVKKLKKEI